MAESDPIDLFDTLADLSSSAWTCPSCGNTRCRTCGRSVTQDFTTPSKRRQERDADFDQIDKVALFDDWAAMNRYDSVSRTYLNED
jgi:hypothetical protein